MLLHKGFSPMSRNAQEESVLHHAANNTAALLETITQMRSTLGELIGEPASAGASGEVAALCAGRCQT